MSQEHRFCAEIYARLFPFIDRDERVVINPDGQAKLPNFLDTETPPDMCFTLKGQKKEIRLEAKVLNKKSVKLQESQKVWCRQDNHPLAPHLWIFAERHLEQCWLLEHNHISQVIRQKIGVSAPLNLWPNQTRPQGCSLEQLAMQIINWALNRN